MRAALWRSEGSAGSENARRGAGASASSHNPSASPGETLLIQLAYLGSPISITPIIDKHVPPVYTYARVAACKSQIANLPPPNRKNWLSFGARMKLIVEVASSAPNRAGTFLSLPPSVGINRAADRDGIIHRFFFSRASGRYGVQ